MMKKSNYAAELEIMIHCGIIKDIYTETTDNIFKNYCDLRNFYIETFTIMNAIKKCNLIVINQLVFKKLPKLTSLEI